MISDNIRKALKTCDDGMTVREIAETLALAPSRIYPLLKNMQVAYVDRWQTTERGKYEAVYAVVDVPADCPKPGRA